MQASRADCPACGSPRTRAVLSMADIPVHSCVLVESAAAARAFPVGDLELAHCEQCDFLFNAAFDPGRVDYSEDYEETQGCSPTFARWLAELADELATRLSLTGKRVVEIGCGRGDFLEALCRRADAYGLGIDPSATAGRADRTAGRGLEFRRTVYGPEHAALDADLIACRHTLEHLPDVHGFLSLLRENLAGTDTPVFLEVPDVERALREGAFWDFYYEHSSYFDAGSLRRALESTGFDIEELRLSYGDQYLQVLARPTRRPGEASDTGGLGPLVDAFRTGFERTRATWEERLAEAARRGDTVALWGSGSKATAFLSALRGAEAVRAVVDINPQKHGRFVAGSGAPIVAPAALVELRPALVVIMNPIYREEIGRDLAGMGVDARVLALGVD